MGLTTDRTDECLKLIRPDGQQECYLILPASERAKGFVRPVRQSYLHIACGTVTRMGLALAETYSRDPSFYGGTFCVHCGTHFNLRVPDREVDGSFKLTDGQVTYHFAFAWDPPDGSYVGE